MNPLLPLYKIGQTVRFINHFEFDHFIRRNQKFHITDVSNNTYFPEKYGYYIYWGTYKFYKTTLIDGLYEKQLTTI